MSCKAIDDIWKCFQELESQEKLNITAENYIEELKFFLRYVRVHVKRGIFFSSNSLCKLESWIEYVEKNLIQPTRNGSLEADVLEEILSSLLLNIHWIKEDLHLKFSDYYHSECNSQGFAYQDVVIDELVTDWLDPLLGNLKHLSRCSDLNLIVLPKEQIRELEEQLISLRNFIEIVGNEWHGLIEKTSEDLFTWVKSLIGNALYLSYLSWMQRKTFNQGKFFFDLLVEMNHIKPEIRMIYAQFLKASKIANPGNLGIDIQALAAMDSLVDDLEKLLKGQDASFSMPLDLHQIEFLNQELCFLKSCLMDPYLEQYVDPEQQNFNSLLTKVESMVKQGASLTRSICEGQAKDHIADAMDFLQFDLPELVNILKSEFREMYLKVPKPSIPSFPQTPTSGFLECFLRRLNELLKHKADSFAYVKNEIETLQRDFSVLSSSLRDIIKNPEKDDNIARCVIDLAYEAEHVIDLISASHFPRWYYMFWLLDISKKAKKLKEESIEVCGKKACKVTVLNVEKASTYPRAQDFTPRGADDHVVGFNDEAEKLIDRLAGGPENLDIVSIVGMPGLGKTTLAKKVYEHPSITMYFHVQAWYCVSQVYEKQNLLLSILDDVTGKNIQKSHDEDTAEDLDEEDIASELYRSLKGRRYLVVIDDIWSIDPWKNIRNSFPDDYNGSRILFTTRNREVALVANPRSAPHDLGLFPGEDSWKLLKNKVYKQRSCPAGLLEIGKRIAQNCKGIPLLVVLIAGILRTTENEDQWRQISESLEKQAASVSTECRDVLELSYKHLPDHLKPCFLYLGAFPEDQEIPIGKLVRLWIAEGLVQRTEFESLQEVAEGYLKDLVSRSLVLVARNKCTRGIKSCHLHDLWHEFSIEKARDEKFFLRSHELVDPEQYRHCFYCPEKLFSGWMPNYPHVRSMLCFPTSDGSSHYCYNPCAADLSVLPHILKLLRVLDLECISIGHQFPKFEFLVHLRYLAVCGSMNQVPSSLGKLWRLETLIVKGKNGQIKLPGILLEMAYLKHVYVNDWAFFYLPDTYQPEKSFESDGIEKLCTPSFRYGDGTTEKVIRRLRSLRKLKCIFLESWDYSRHCNRFPVLDSLTKLESLNVTYYGSARLPLEFSFPSNVKKLTLSMFHLHWSNISMIGRLPKLEVLKLLSEAFEGPRWEVSDDEFRKLKFLKLESLDIEEWDASPDAFPCLEQLVLQGCDRLEDIPSSFGESSTLRMIQVQWCSYSATEAARRIQEEQEDLGTDGGLKVFIKTSHPDFAPAS